MSNIQVTTFKDKFNQLKVNLSVPTAVRLFAYIKQVAERSELDSKLLAHAFLLVTLAYLYQIEIENNPEDSPEGWLDEFDQSKRADHLQQGLECFVDRPLPLAESATLILFQLYSTVTENQDFFAVETESNYLIQPYLTLRQQMLPLPQQSIASALTSIGFFLGVVSVGSLFLGLSLQSGALFLAALGLLMVSVSVASYGLLQENSLFRQKREVGDQTFYSTIACAPSTSG